MNEANPYEQQSAELAAKYALDGDFNGLDGFNPYEYLSIHWQINNGLPVTREQREWVRQVDRDRERRNSGKVSGPGLIRRSMFYVRGFAVIAAVLAGFALIGMIPSDHDKVIVMGVVIFVLLGIILNLSERPQRR